MEHQNMKKTSFTTQELVFTALMTALVFVATYLPHIPIPLGYAHLGDAVIFLLALLAPRRAALFAACIGSALADLLGGFALWIVPTLVIKFVMAEIVYRIGRRGDAIVPRASIIAALLLSSLWMAAAYTLAGAVLYASMSAALASTPGLLMEGLVNSVLALLLLPMLRERFPKF
ncbi:ECF-type riboflavin transporter, S component [Selenomonas sp. FOBRC6]|nr:ECF transporter S component [Selenomonas sp. FOBRC6]EJO19286.1 ECF-type riboflavin transporter, S component [Selenomonas sp. FOBRC6]